MIKIFNCNAKIIQTKIEAKQNGAINHKFTIVINFKQDNSNDLI